MSNFYVSSLTNDFFRRHIRRCPTELCVVCKSVITNSFFLLTPSICIKKSVYNYVFLAKNWGKEYPTLLIFLNAFPSLRRNFRNIQLDSTIDSGIYFTSNVNFFSQKKYIWNFKSYVSSKYKNKLNIRNTLIMFSLWFHFKLSGLVSHKERVFVRSVIILPLLEMKLH